MIIELSGKGIICNVHYLSKANFEKLKTHANAEDQGVGHFIEEYADTKIEVSRGFFADDPNLICRFIDQAGSRRELKANDFKAWRDLFVSGARGLLEEELDDELDIFTERTFDFDYHPHPESSQVAIVSYHEFKDGVSRTDLPLDSFNQLAGLRFICRSVDCGGFVAECTYEETIVGSEEYEYAEEAIHAFRIRDEIYPVSLPVYSDPHTRCFAYTYDEEDEKHNLDFFENKNLHWGSKGRPTSGVHLDKALMIRAENIVWIQTFRKRLQGVDITVQTESFEDWNDLKLTMPIGVNIPESGKQFKTSELGVAVEVIEISNNCEVQHAIYSSRPISEDLEREVNELIETQHIEEWENESTYVIKDYQLIAPDN